jgi:hypothetical protein
VDEIVKAHGEKVVDGEEMNVQVGSGFDVASEITTVQDKPRPPKLDDTISNLRALMEHSQMENVNSVANQDALTSSYASKKALIESLLAGPQQAVVARAEERLLCDKEVRALEQLEGIVGGAVERGHSISQMRKDQAAHYTDMTETIKKLNLKNLATLDQVHKLIEQEIAAEKDINGAVHFDPVALRQQQPEDMLRHAEELTANLISLMTAKMSHHDEALSQIKGAFACPECESAATQLQTAGAVVRSDLETAKHKCAAMIESHRALDESDREKVLALKKDLEDIEAAEKVHQAAELALKDERQRAQHVAEKMIGFYQNLPGTKKSN